MSSEAWRMRPEGRHAARRAAGAASTLRTDGMRATDVTVLDLSTSGVRIATPVRLAVGQEISIGLAGVGARGACVAWAGEDEYGCRLAEPLSEDEAAAAFAGQSVVPIGFVAAPAQRSATAAKLDEVYARHRPWAIPLDAVVALGGCVGVLGGAFWLLVRGSGG